MTAEPAEKEDMTVSADDDSSRSVIGAGMCAAALLLTVGFAGAASAAEPVSSIDHLKSLSGRKADAERPGQSFRPPSEPVMDYVTRMSGIKVPIKTLGDVLKSNINAPF